MEPEEAACYDSGGEESNSVLRALGFEIALKDGVLPRFIVGRRYTREEIQELLKVPEDQRRGNWDTGYSEWGGAYYLFCNVGQAGSTGHNYENHFDGEFLVWRSKGGTSLQQPVIRELLDPGITKHVFFREKLRLPFV